MSHLICIYIVCPALSLNFQHDIHAAWVKHFLKFAEINFVAVWFVGALRVKVKHYPVGIWCQKDAAMTSMGHDIITLHQH